MPLKVSRTASNSSLRNSDICSLGLQDKKFVSVDSADKNFEPQPEHTVILLSRAIGAALAVRFDLNFLLRSVGGWTLTSLKSLRMRHLLQLLLLPILR